MEIDRRQFTGKNCRNQFTIIINQIRRKAVVLLYFSLLVTVNKSKVKIWRFEAKTYIRFFLPAEEAIIYIAATEPLFYRIW